MIVLRRMKICSRVVLGLMTVLVAVMGGCLMPPSPNDVDAVAAYNTQIMSIIAPLLTPVVTLLGILALWLKSNWDKRELGQKTENAARQLSEASHQRNERVIEEVRQQKDLNANALSAANNFNEKLLAVAENKKRAPSRSTDVQKVEITGPGVETALKVEDAKPRK